MNAPIDSVARLALPFAYTSKKGPGISVSFPNVWALPMATQQYWVLKGANESFDNAHNTITVKAFPDAADRTSRVKEIVDAHFAKMLRGEVPGAPPVQLSPEAMALVAAAESNDPAVKALVAKILAAAGK